jgi:hypothetical protein
MTPSQAYGITAAIKKMIRAEQGKLDIWEEQIDWEQVLIDALLETND